MSTAMWIGVAVLVTIIVAGRLFSGGRSSGKGRRRRGGGGGGDWDDFDSGSSSED